MYYAKGLGAGEGQAAEYAVKVFKTSILVFKDRDRYVSGAQTGRMSMHDGTGGCLKGGWRGVRRLQRPLTFGLDRWSGVTLCKPSLHACLAPLYTPKTGEFRFRHGYCRSNPRKMVKLWAEKEMRNLKRCAALSFLPCVGPCIHACMHARSARQRRPTATSRSTYMDCTTTTGSPPPASPPRGPSSSRATCW